MPVDETGTKLDNEFGKARQFAAARYDRAAKAVRETWLVANPLADIQHNRGIRLAEFLIDQDADGVVCREDLRDKGPGLMFHRFGVDVRTTGETELTSLLTDYAGRSRSVFEDREDGAVPPEATADTPALGHAGTTAP